MGSLTLIDAAEPGSGWQYSTDDGATWTTGHGKWLVLDQLPGTSTIRLAPLDMEGIRGEVTILNRDGSEVGPSAFVGTLGLMSSFDPLFGGLESLPTDFTDHPSDDPSDDITAMSTNGLHDFPLQAQGTYPLEPLHTGSVIPV